MTRVLLEAIVASLLLCVLCIILGIFVSPLLFYFLILVGIIAVIFVAFSKKDI